FTAPPTIGTYTLSLHDALPIFAGVDESPGAVEETEGGAVKAYRGMGSLGAMQARRSRDRYGQGEVGDFSKLVPEGVEGHVSAVGDRKSTRLNSSHVSISYAVFC